MISEKDILAELTKLGIGYEFDKQDQAYFIYYGNEYGRLYDDNPFKIEYEYTHYPINDITDIVKIADLMITKSNESLNAKKIAELIESLELKYINIANQTFKIKHLTSYMELTMMTSNTWSLSNESGFICKIQSMHELAEELKVFKKSAELGNLNYIADKFNLTELTEVDTNIFTVKCYGNELVLDLSDKEWRVKDNGKWGNRFEKSFTVLTKILHTIVKKYTVQSEQSKEKKKMTINTKPEFINDYETIKASEYVINKNLKVISDIMYKYTKDDSPSIIIEGDDTVFFYAGEDHNELVFVIEDGEESKSFVFDDRKIDLISDFKLEYLTTISRLLGESVKKWISDFADFKVDPKVDREEIINEMEAATHGTRIMIKIISDIVSKYQ